MKIIGKILAAIGVLIIGALLMAGSLWLNFHNLKFGKQTNDPAAESAQTGGAKDAAAGTVPAPESSNILPITTREKSVTATAAPEKLAPAPEVISTPAGGQMAPVAPDPAATDYILTRSGVIEETNRQRQINLGSGHVLVENALLDQAAQAKVDDMFAGQYFEHVSPLGDDASYFIGKTGYQYVAIGENLAMGSYRGDAALVKAWMDSPGHRENILKNGFTEIGVAVGYGQFDGRMVWFAVQEFGTPESACPEVDQKLSTLIHGEKILLDDYASKQEALTATIDMKKDVVLSLEEDLSSLAAASNSYSAVRGAQEKLDDAVTNVNALIEEYNTSVSQAKALYEQYKADVDEYNSQVTGYNNCIGAI
jgi:uncharacterized protein YkwD